MSTNQQDKRITKQIRIGEDTHRILKLRSIELGKTMSKLADEILQKYFKDYADSEEDN